MDDLIDWAGNVFESIFNFFEIIIEFLTTIIDLFSAQFDQIAVGLGFVTTALETALNFAKYWPVYIWSPIATILSLVVVFRVLRIILSGG